jgi:hypothetical protein
MKITKPKENIIIEREISLIELRKLLKTIPGCPDKIYMTDRVYQIPKYPAKVIDIVPASVFQYVPDKRDCDDFVRIFRGILSMWGYGNLLAMQCHIKYPNRKITHELIAFVHGGKFLFGEPQTGLLKQVPSGTKILRLII